MLDLSRRVFGAYIAAVLAPDFSAFGGIGRVLELYECVQNFEVTSAGHCKSAFVVVASYSNTL